MEKLDFVVMNVQKCWRKMFKVKRSLFKYNNSSLGEDFIKKPWKGRWKHCSTADMDQNKNEESKSYLQGKYLAERSTFSNKDG